MEIGMAEIELQWSAGKSKLTAEVLLFVLNNEPPEPGCSDPAQISGHFIPCDPIRRGQKPANPLPW
jgi:hypothetical protein